MLRSLINDPEDPRHGQPKPRGEMSKGELHYLDETVPEQEENLLIARFRSQAERDEVLTAAKRVNAAGGAEAKK